MRRALFIGWALALGVTVAALAGCGGSGKPSTAELQMQKEATLYQIEQIEKTFHKAATTHDVNLMMTLFAPGAVFNLGTETYTGRGQIRKFFSTKNKAFFPQNHWQADTPSFPDQGDGERRQGNALFRVRLHRHQDEQAGWQRSGSITRCRRSTGSVADHRPHPRRRRRFPPRDELMAHPGALRRSSPGRRWPALVGSDNPLVRAVAVAPARVRTKLLVAFLGIAALLVLVGVLGLRFLAQWRTRGWRGSGPCRLARRRMTSSRRRRACCASCSGSATAAIPALRP